MANNRHLRTLQLACLGTAFAVLVSGWATARPASASPLAKTYTFDFANVTESGPLFVTLHKGVDHAAAIAAVTIKAYNNNFDGPTALRNASLMVQDKPDLILEYNAVEGIGASLGRMFNRAKIPCIAINVPTPGCAWFNLVNRTLGASTGAVVAKTAKQKGWTAKNTTVIIVQNATAGREVNDCVRYFYVTVAKMMPGMTRVPPSSITPQTTRIGTTGVQVNGASALEPSFTAVKNILQTIPASRHILLYTVNDDSTIGAWRAITQAHRESNTLVAGLGGDKDGLTQLRTNPHWVAEGDVFVYFWGEYLMAMGRSPSCSNSTSVTCRRLIARCSPA
jgi:ribose transport system substrate-binding protein